MLLAGALAGCAASPRSGNEVKDKIDDVLLKSATERKAPAAELSDKSLMPPLAPPTAVDVAATEPRFDLSVINAPATQVFMALVSGTRYSMLLPPDVGGNLTVNLKDVTVMEALDTIRELYGYEYRIQGRRIFIEPNTVKSRVFQINYLASQRQGSSDLRVSGSSTSGGGTGGAAAATPTPGQTTPAGAGTPTAGRSSDTSRVSMSTYSDFWGDLTRTLTSIVGTTEGRSVVVNPSSGVVLVRALPTELRNVEKYLKATQLVAERQVMLEAKIIDVTLSEDFLAGVNWGAFKSGPNSFSGVGVGQPGVTLRAGAGTAETVGAAASPTISVTPGRAGSIIASTLGKGFIGLAFQTSNFAALLNFLETQGSVSVLSSPRIATLNNQKAVLKVGADEFFVTNLTVSAGTTTATGATGPATITPQFQSMFSGISLDVTPQIDDEGNIILHVHPAVTTISESQKTIDLGGATGVISVPLAVSRINETDSIVRVQNGNIVAIGGLMRQAQTSDRSQLPGSTGIVANALGQRGSSMSKRELVILIKPTLIDNDRVWAQDIKDVQERVRAYPSVRPAE
jgi:MSHA biogenesis protein MshL